MCVLATLSILGRSHSRSTTLTLKSGQVGFSEIFETKNSPHRTESVRAIISHGDVRGKVQAAYHAG